MQKITVLLDTSPLQTGSSIRGIGTYTRFLKQALEACDDISVIAVEKPKDLKQLQKKRPTLDPQYTLIHYPFFDLFFATLPLFRPFKTVVTIHDLIPLKFPKYYKPGLKGTLRFHQQALALKGVDAIITDSHASQTDIYELLKVQPNTVDVVHLAASPAITAQPEALQEQVRKKLQLPKNYLLYIGDINYNKNIPQLIKMLKFIPDELHLVCVGKNFFPHDIPEWQWIETQVALSDVSARVHFLNQIGAEETETLSALYSGAVAYIQPSLYEGFGLPILEAMQAKCPVVAARNSSIIEVSRDHAVLVEPEAEALAAGVQSILDWSKTYRQEVIKNAYTWSQEFSWTKVARQTVQVYKRALNVS